MWVMIQITCPCGSPNPLLVYHPRSVHENLLTNVFSTPFFQEYYEEDVVREIYIDVVEKLLLSLPEEDSRLQKNGGDVTVQDADANNFWPPWPWPPWGGGDDDDDDDDDKPGNWTDRARKLARGAVKFERRIAKASLDL